MHKILVLSNHFSGLASFRKEVFVALLKERYQVTIAAPESIESEIFREMGCTIIYTRNLNRHGTNPLKDFALLNEYRRIIRQVKPDIVLTYTIKPNIYGGMACKLSRKPYIVNITGLGSAVETPGILQKLTTTLYQIGMSGARKIFFQNSANRKFFEQHSIRKDIHAQIPGSGVNLTHHSLREYPSNDNPIKFLFISRVMKQKGIEEYFAAAEHFKGRGMEFHILGACEEDYSQRINELVDAGVVIYHGKQKDVRPFITEAHCLIHPSFYPEGMSNVILESAAAGRPVITTRRPGCQEAVDDGISGFLITPQDTEDLIKATERFVALSHEAKKEMGIAGRKKMEREFDRNIVVKEYLDAIRVILNK